jgi:cobalt-zinc-cadmium efflux system protein
LETVQILLEGTPSGIDLARLRREIEASRGVAGVHDLHAWSLSAQQVALSCHVVVDEGLTAAQGEHLVRELESLVCERFGIGHTTIQVEACHPCDQGDVHAPGVHNHPHTAGVG